MLTLLAAATRCITASSTAARRCSSEAGSRSPVVDNGSSIHSASCMSSVPRSIVDNGSSICSASCMSSVPCSVHLRADMHPVGLPPPRASGRRCSAASSMSTSPSSESMPLPVVMGAVMCWKTLLAHSSSVSFAPATGTAVADGALAASRLGVLAPAEPGDDIHPKSLNRRLAASCASDMVKLSISICDTSFACDHSGSSE